MAETSPEQYIVSQAEELMRKHYTVIDRGILEAYINLKSRNDKYIATFCLSLIGLIVLLPTLLFVWIYTEPSAPPITDCSIVSAVELFPDEIQTEQVNWVNMNQYSGFTDVPSDMSFGKNDKKFCISWKGVTTCFERDTPSKIQ